MSITLMFILAGWFILSVILWILMDAPFEKVRPKVFFAPYRKKYNLFGVILFGGISYIFFLPAVIYSYIIYKIVCGLGWTFERLQKPFMFVFGRRK